jgi:hypothetical protein
MSNRIQFSEKLVERAASATVTESFGVCWSVEMRFIDSMKALEGLPSPGRKLTLLGFLRRPFPGIH